MRVLGLDVGDRRTGVAISDPMGMLARPLQVLMGDSVLEEMDAIAALVDEHQVGRVVVGHPLNMDGSAGPQAQRVAEYARGLADRLPVAVELWDERSTTEKAEQIMRQTRSERKRRRARASGELDAIAAAVILQSYLDNHMAKLRLESGQQHGRVSSQ